MKKLTPKSLLAIVFIAVASTLLGSCKRDKLSKEPDGPPCQIKKIIVGHPDPLVAQRSGEFTYNAAGDPITYTPQGYTTGSCKYEFRYDNKGRLTEYIGYYPSGSFEFWARFTYNDKNKIIRDTSYHYGPYGPVLTTYYNVKRVTEYEYDQEGRVS
ncbi:MAG TPA: hypothetical protein VFZ47_02640, partial [Chitinophagaceae bacterium]